MGPVRARCLLRVRSSAFGASCGWRLMADSVEKLLRVDSAARHRKSRPSRTRSERRKQRAWRFLTPRFRGRNARDEFFNRIGRSATVESEREWFSSTVAVRPVAVGRALEKRTFVTSVCAGPGAVRWILGRSGEPLESSSRSLRYLGPP